MPIKHKETKSLLITAVLSALGVAMCGVSIPAAAQTQTVSTAHSASKDNTQNDVAEFKKLKQKAEAGDAQAQSSLGVMYCEGKGVAQNHHEATRWVEKAAAQGYAAAQNNLGLMYEHGKGVAQSNKEAYAWFVAAQANGDSSAAASREAISKKLSKSELREAQALGSMYLKKYQPKAAS